MQRTAAEIEDINVTSHSEENSYTSHVEFQGSRTIMRSVNPRLLVRMRWICRGQAGNRSSCATFRYGPLVDL